MICMVWRWGLWWRPFGKHGSGVCVERDMPMEFSERYGYRKVYRIGRWAMTFHRAFPKLEP